MTKGIREWNLSFTNHMFKANIFIWMLFFYNGFEIFLRMLHRKTQFEDSVISSHRRNIVGRIREQYSFWFWRILKSVSCECIAGGEPGHYHTREKENSCYFKILFPLVIFGLIHFSNKISLFGEFNLGTKLKDRVKISQNFWNFYTLTVYKKKPFGEKLKMFVFF